MQVAVVHNGLRAKEPAGDLSVPARQSQRHEEHA
jgi:hypothetical protein